MADENPFAHLIPSKKASPLWDALRSGATGVRSGVEGMIGLPGDVAMGARWLNNAAMTKLGFEDRPDYVAGTGDYAPMGGVELPSTAGVRELTDAAIGPGYEPQTTGGEYAKTVGEFVPGMLAGPGGLARRAVTNVVAPGVTSEAAGQATEGSDYEPLARILGALTGGMGASMLATPRPAGPLTQAQAQRTGLVLDMDAQGVHLPNIAMPDSGGTYTGAKLGQIPHFGQFLRRSADRTVEDIGRRMDDIAQVGTRPGRTASNDQLRDTLHHWQDRTSRDLMKRAYDAVDSHITQPRRTTPLTNTQRLVREIRREQSRSTSRAPDSALALVEEAVNRPGGLTYDGLKRLRTEEIGERMSGAIAPEPGTSQPTLKRLYGALTSDLERAVRRAGGRPALAAWHAANNEARLINNRRDMLARIIGVRGEASPDAVANRMLNLAKDTNAGSAGMLGNARDALTQATVGGGTQVWDDMVSNVIARMGRDPGSPTRQFSPDRFLTSYGKISEQGRRNLFGPLNDDLAALSRLSEAHRNLMRQGNPSGTGGVVTLGTLGGALLTAPLTTMFTLAGGNGLAYLLSRRATAQKLVNWARARNGLWENRSGVQLQTFLEASRQVTEALAEGTGDDPDEMMDALMNMPADDVDIFGHLK